MLKYIIEKGEKRWFEAKISFETLWAFKLSNTFPWKKRKEKQFCANFLRCSEDLLPKFSLLFAAINKVKETPYPSILDFWKIKFKKSNSTNWIFDLKKSISKLIFAGYTCSKNPVQNGLKLQFVDIDFSNLIFQNSSTDG